MVLVRRGLWFYQNVGANSNIKTKKNVLRVIKRKHKKKEKIKENKIRKEIFESL